MNRVDNMKLLKELNELTPGLSFNNIQIEDHKFTADNITRTGKGEAKCYDFLIEGWFDGVVENGEPPSFKASLTIDMEYGYDDDSVAYARGSEVGNHQLGDGSFMVNPYHMMIEKIRYVDTHGHRSSDMPKEVIQAYGNEDMAERQLSKKFNNYIKSDMISNEFKKFLNFDE